MTSMNITETTDEMPFAYQIINKGSGSVKVDVGDLFEKSDIWPNTGEGYLQQIGLDMVRKGLQFLGLDAEECRMLCLLALQYSNTTDFEDDEDWDDE